VLDGITLYVAEVGEPLKTTAGEVDRRLRLISRMALRAICCFVLCNVRFTTILLHADWSRPTADNFHSAAT